MEMDRYILEKFFMDEADQTEIAAIEKWVRESDANMDEFQKAYDQFILTTLTVSKLELEAEMTRARNVMRISRIRRDLVYAVSVAAAILLGVFLNWRLGMSDPSSQMLTLQTDYGQRASLTLPDGTVVELNSGSTLEYPAAFSRRERRVRIEGEAMFDVAKDARKPFLVETFAYDVKVLGTKFNVIAEEQTGEFSTALIEGRVSILDKDHEVVTELKPDQIAVMTDGKLSRIQSENIGAQYRWTDGIVNCNGLVFAEVLRKFERSFGVRIVTEMDTVPANRIRYMKVYVSDGPAAALELLKEVVHFDYTYDHKTNTYHLR